MKWKMILGAILILLIVGGCEGLWQNIADPNSGLNETVGALGTMTPAIGGAAGATGTPWGATVGLFATIIAVGVGVYNNYRKKVVIGEKDSDITNYRETTKAIVQAIDELESVELKDGGTLGDYVKSLVGDNLKKKDWYRIGRAIISGLKE